MAQAADVKQDIEAGQSGRGKSVAAAPRASARKSRSSRTRRVTHGPLESLALVSGIGAMATWLLNQQ